MSVFFNGSRFCNPDTCVQRFTWNDQKSTQVWFYWILSFMWTFREHKYGHFIIRLNSLIRLTNYANPECKKLMVIFKILNSENLYNIEHWLVTLTDIKLKPKSSVRMVVNLKDLYTIIFVFSLHVYINLDIQIRSPYLEMQSVRLSACQVVRSCTMFSISADFKTKTCSLCERCSQIYKKHNLQNEKFLVTKSTLMLNIEQGV